MANVKYGGLVSDVRGSIAGCCFSRGSGGAIVRNAPKPVNPRSPAQGLVRAAMSYLTQYWSATLTAEEREAWKTYAFNTTWTNKVGTAAQISGLAAFVRLNTLLVQGGYDVQDPAPTSYGHAGTPTFTFAADAADFGIAIAEPTAPFDKDVDDARMIFHMRGATNIGRTALSGQRRYLNTVVGDAVTAPTFPTDFTSPLGFSNGQMISVSGIYIDPEGRIGNAYIAQIESETP